MFQPKSILRMMASLLCAMLLVTVIPVSSSETVQAATVSTFSSTKKAIVCGKSAKIKVPSSYKNTKFSSSNKKVATVSSKGVVKAVRLGVAKITAKSGKKKKTYTITVKPAKASQVWLSQTAILTGQKLTFKLASDKYDTSQVSLKFSSSFSQISSSGKCSGFSESGSGWQSGTVTYSYGQFQKSSTLEIYSPDWIYSSLLAGGTDGTNLLAATSYTVGITGTDSKTMTVSQLREKGISVLLDGKKMGDTVTYSVGDHTLTLVSGTTKKDKAITVSYSVRDALRYRDATGYQASAKLVFDAAFTAVDQIITDGMSDAEKALAIHDYLIYHANYVNDGDYTTAENWAFGAEGVLLHGEGVCQSYAFAFYMMATAVGLKCDYITSATHAWNSVYIDGVRYYVDCTFDDPIGPTGAGGYENHDYFLSPTLWTDEEHVIESVTDLAEDGKYYWEYYYLTGEGYYLPWKTTSRTENQILVPTQSSAADVTIRVCPTRISW